MVELDILKIIMIGLAAFRLTRLVVFDRITNFIRKPFMDIVIDMDKDGHEEGYYVPKTKGIKGWIGQLLNCYWCTGMWMSMLLVSFHIFIPVLGDFLITILAVAAIGALIETGVSHKLDE